MATSPAKRPIRAGVLPPPQILREVLRHYVEFRELVANGGSHMLEYSYVVDDGEGESHKENISFSFWDLHRGISELAPRKREALFYNVILDQKQHVVADIMGITTVSVGQYVKNACAQLSKYHS